MTVTKIRLYLDEDSIKNSLVVTLRNAGVDVITASEANKLSCTDEEQLIWATKGDRTYSTFQVSEVHNRGRDTAVPCPYGNRRAIGVYFINVESAVINK